MRVSSFPRLLCIDKVTLTTDKQEVRVKNLTELTMISQQSNQTQKGQNPVTHLTTQTFNIGGQTLTFDLSHEVYTYTTSTKQQVEMPYLRLSAAKYGEAKMETRSATVKEIAVTGIRLIPIATRLLSQFTPAETAHSIQRAPFI